MLYSATSPPRIYTLILLAGMAVLSLNMFVPSLANMAAEFRVSYSLISLSIAGYMAVTAVLQLVIGPLSDRFGRRPVLLAALAVFTGASLVCALTTHVWLFLAFRVLQGAVAAGWAISLAVIRDTAPPQEAASKIGYVSMAMAVAPMLGPMVGGGLDELFGWRANFVAYGLLGVVAFSLVWIDLGETNRTPSKTFAAQFRTYPALVRSRRYWGYALCAVFSRGAFFAFLAGAPLVAVALLNLSPAELGFYIGTITAGYGLGSFLSGRYAQRFALTTMMISGRIVACAGLVVGLALFLAGLEHEFALFGATVFVGLGNGLTMPSCESGAMSVRPKLAGSAMGLAGALTVGTGAVLTSITAVIVTGETGAYALLGMMLFCTLLALAGALQVRRIDRLEARVQPSPVGQVSPTR